MKKRVALLSVNVREGMGLTMMGLVRRCFLKVALASGMVFLLTSPAPAAGPEVLRITDELVKAAKAEGSVTLRHQSPVPQTDGIARAFTRQYGIKVDIDRKVGALGTQQFLIEERAGKHIVDVWWTSDYTGKEVAKKEGFLLSYTYPDVKERFIDGTYEEGWGYSDNMIKVVIQYNPQLISHAEAKRLFKTWRGLLDPSLKGKIGMTEPGGGGIPFVTYMMFYLRPEYGRDFFVNLAAQNPRVYPGSAPGREDLAAGATSVFLPNWEEVGFVEFMKGDRTAWTYPEIAPVYPSTRTFISKNAPHPNAARLFALFLTTPEGIQAFQSVGQSSTVKGAKDSREAIAKLKQTEWWKPYPLEIGWTPDEQYQVNNFDRLLKDMREILGWKR
jgi:iron(III) transport system substrate-binding protein